MRLDGLSAALRIAALRLLLELILKADQVWKALISRAHVRPKESGAGSADVCASAVGLVARARSRTFTPWDLKGGEWFLPVHCVLVEIKTVSNLCE